MGDREESAHLRDGGGDLVHLDVWWRRFCCSDMEIFFWRSYLFIGMIIHKMLERWPEQNTSRDGSA